MSQTLISVGFGFPGEVVECVDLIHKRSLLDADIIYFSPMLGLFESEESYHGKPMLSETDSFILTDSMKHWRTELNASLEAGKTIFLVMCEPDSVYVYTGQKKYEGTGRNRLTTDIVDLAENYSCVPFKLGAIRSAHGSVIRPAGNLSLLSAFWNDFGKFCSYKAHLDCEPKGTLLITRTGRKAVGGIYPVSNGWVVLLPMITLSGGEYMRGPYWTNAAKKVGKRLVQHSVAIHKNLGAGRSDAPPPEWVAASEFEDQEATRIQAGIDLAETEILRLRDKIRNELDRLRDAEAPKRLLYEKGKPLEYAIIDSLKLLGFEAEGFAHGESEFDIIFASPEGRFVGEIEGKDHTAINVDKLSQLERNLQEDFQRDEVEEYAKGVLFGNASRLLSPPERRTFFTRKCLSGAKRAGVALVRTPDLYPIVQYLRRNPKSTGYMRKCREVILSTSGEEVVFPNPPRARRKAGPKKKSSGSVSRSKTGS